MYNNCGTGQPLATVADLFAAAVLVTPQPHLLYHTHFDHSTPFSLQTFVYVLFVLFYQISSSKFLGNLGTGFSERKPCSVFFAAVLRLCKPLCCTSENLGTRNAYGGVVVPHMQPDHTTFCDFILCGCGLRNKMPVLSHSPCGFAQPQTANAATPQPPPRLLRASGSLRSSSR